MKTLYLECNMGAAGDMLMSALAELLPEPEAFYEKLNQIGLPGVTVIREPAVKCGIVGAHARVLTDGVEEECPSGHHHEETQHFHSAPEDIYKIIDSLRISKEEKEDIRHIYESIARAESRVHGCKVEQIHFHEVGTMDAVADITGCVMAMHMLGKMRIIVSPVNVGYGQVHCAHGILPVPAPATAVLLEGIPSYAGEIEGELCTPTGAAILKYFGGEFKRMPPMMIERIGYGMGKKDFPAANCIRAVLGETKEDGDLIAELCCNLDDMTPEELGYCMELLWEAGALDVFTTPIGMKKSRPGILLSVMCRMEEKDKLAGLIFANTTTLGIREYACKRMVLSRNLREDTVLGHGIRVKTASGYGVVREKPEYEDLKQAAKAEGISLLEAKEAWMKSEK